MSFRPAMMKSTAALLISTLLLSACASGRSVVIDGPVLSYPPPAAVEALIETAIADPDTAAWFDEMDRYYTKLEVSDRL